MSKSWLAYESDKIWSCGDTKRSGSPRIRAVHEMTALEGLGPGAHVENTWLGLAPVDFFRAHVLPFPLRQALLKLPIP